MFQCPVTQSVLDTLYTKKLVRHVFDEYVDDLNPDLNEYFIFQGEGKSSAIVRYMGDDNWKLVDPKIQINATRPKDAEQVALMDALLDPEIKIISVVGPAGCGKTFLSLSYALEVITMKQNDLTLVLTKSTETVKNSRFFGAVPGGVDEKFAPFLDSFDLAIRKIAGEKTYFDLMKDKRKILYKPIEFCRGDSRENSILIADEMQNVSWHEVKTLVSRFGENSKCILLGDLNQKDINRGQDSGLEVLFESEVFARSPITAHVKLLNDYRGPISKLIGEIDDEFRK
jgi:PhoH-like ATPase